MFAVRKTAYPFKTGRIKYETNINNENETSTTEVGINTLKIILDTPRVLIGMQGNIYFGLLKQDYKTRTGDSNYTLYCSIHKSVLDSYLFNGELCNNQTEIRNTYAVHMIYKSLIDGATNNYRSNWHVDANLEYSTFGIHKNACTGTTRDLAEYALNTYENYESKHIIPFLRTIPTEKEAFKAHITTKPLLKIVNQAEYDSKSIYDIYELGIPAAVVIFVKLIHANSIGNDFDKRNAKNLLKTLGENNILKQRYFFVYSENRYNICPSTSNTFDSISDFISTLKSYFGNPGERFFQYIEGANINTTGFNTFKFFLTNQLNLTTNISSIRESLSTLSAESLFEQPILMPTPRVIEHIFDDRTVPQVFIDMLLNEDETDYRLDNMVFSVPIPRRQGIEPFGVAYVTVQMRNFHSDESIEIISDIPVVCRYLKGNRWSSMLNSDNNRKWKIEGSDFIQIPEYEGVLLLQFLNSSNSVNIVPAIKIIHSKFINRSIFAHHEGSSIWNA